MTARLYYYPDPDGYLKRIDLPHVSEFPAPIPSVYREDARLLHGGVVSTYFGMSYRVSVTISGISSASTAGQTFLHELRSLESHLAAGGVVGFCTDATKAWCGRIISPSRGQSTYQGINGFKAWSSGTASLSNGDRFVVENGPPLSMAEHLTVDTMTGSASSTMAITAASSGLKTFSGVCIYRYRDFYPVLRAAPDTAPYVENDDGRRVSEVVLTLDYHPADVIAAFGSGGTVYGGVSVSMGTGAMDIGLRGVSGEAAYSGGIALDSVIGSGSTVRPWSSARLLSKGSLGRISPTWRP
jgi:hypothetical protein